MISSYATRSAILAEDSLLAFTIGSRTHVRQVRAQGLALEASALVYALGEAHDSGVTDISFAASAELLDALTRVGAPEQASSLTYALRNIERLLARTPRTLLVSGPDPELGELLVRHSRLSPPLPSWELSAADAAWVALHDATVVYTDGSCSISSMVGSWAYYVDDEHFASGGIEHVATSQTAERRAITEALRAVPGPVLVLGDCAKVLATSGDALLAAMGIPDPLDDLVKERVLRFSHVKGHADCRGNRAADALARTALRARLDLLERDPDLGHAHHASALEAVARTGARQKLRRERQKWCSRRRKELISVRYPNWETMAPEARQKAGRSIYRQSLREFARTQPS